jgi:hypothetical protein
MAAISRQTNARSRSFRKTSLTVAFAASMAFLLIVTLVVSRESNYDVVESPLLATRLSSDTFSVKTNATRNWIWDELSPKEQEVAMRDARKYLEAFVGILNKTKQDRWVSQDRCEVVLFGSQWGTHQLCNIPPPQDCSFLSFGISVDYSFDTDLAEKWHCHGFAADPTIVHKSQLHDLVTFHNIAAKTLRANQEARTAKKPWWVASVPAVKRFLGLKHLSVLKMDCEGCEFSIARDVLKEEPDFFHHVDQFTFEVHLNTHWLNDTESFYYMALMYKLLDEAGLKVMGTSIGGCGWEVEAHPSMQELRDIGYPNAGAKRVFGRRSCHEYLFARVNPQ